MLCLFRAYPAGYHAELWGDGAGQSPEPCPWGTSSVGLTQQSVPDSTWLQTWDVPQRKAPVNSQRSSLGLAVRGFSEEMVLKQRAGQDGFGLGSQGESKQVSGQRPSMSRVSGREEQDLKGSQCAEWRLGASIGWETKHCRNWILEAAFQGCLWTLDLTFKGIGSCQRILDKGDDCTRII